MILQTLLALGIRATRQMLLALLRRGMLATRQMLLTLLGRGMLATRQTLQVDQTSQMQQIRGRSPKRP